MIDDRDRAEHEEVVLKSILKKAYCHNCLGFHHNDCDVCDIEKAINLDYSTIKRELHL
jgi:hypothetical protein